MVQETGERASGGLSTMKKRNEGVELYRCLLMLGIVFIHATGHCRYQQRWGTEFFDWCVAGFVFISGYFGVDFRPSKCVALIGVGIWCSIVAGLLVGADVRATLCGVDGFWFLWAYIILMMLSPLINVALDKCNKDELIRIILPLFLLVCVWMFALCVPIVRDYLPKPRGLAGLSFLSIIPTYMAARIYRRFELDRIITRKFVLIALPICVTLFLCGLWWYWWIPALVVAMSLFKCFYRLRLPAFVGKFVLSLAPSMFAIYMLHFSGGGVRLMTYLQVTLIERYHIPITLSNLIVGLTTFGLCVVVDMFRRGIVVVIRNHIRLICLAMDAAYDNLINKLHG